MVQTPPDIKPQHLREILLQGRQRRVEVLDLLREALHPAELRLRVDHLDLHILHQRETVHQVEATPHHLEAVRQLEVLAQVEVVVHLALQLLVKAAVALEGEEDSFC